MSVIAERINRIKASPSSMMSSRAMALQRQGRDVIRLSSGEPDFDTPEHVKLAAVAAIVEGKTKYPPVNGIPELREAICEKLARENGLEYRPDEVLVCTGGKQVIFNALISTLDPGDEVIIPAPYWVSYPDMVKLAGARPVEVPTTSANAFRITPEQLDAAIGPDTKWLILNNPCNPSGAVYSSTHLEGLAEVLRRRPRVWVLCDDIYEHVVYGDDRFATMAQVAPDLAERTLTMNGFSKAYCMTGWRLGYGAGPGEIIRAMTKVQSQSTSGACAISQWAGVAALQGDQSFMARNLEVFENRRDLAASLINQTSALSCNRPPGAFYLYVDCAQVIGRTTPAGASIESDADFAEYLLDAQGVALVHGEAFGLSPFFRISYAIATDQLEEACVRIQRACGELS